MDQRVPDQRFGGIDRLYGVGSVARLAQAHVCVVGIGALTLIDADEVCVGNTSRQLHALDGEYGRPKVGVMSERARRIRPGIRLQAVEEFLTPSNLERLLARNYDLVIDCCDAFRVKVEAIAWCRRRKLPMITCGSAGGRTDPTLIAVRDLARTEHDAMLALVRRKLREEFRFPRGPKRYFGVQAVYSRENVLYPQADGSVCGTRPAPGDALKLDCASGLGAATHVTAAFACAAVSRAIARLLRAPALAQE